MSASNQRATASRAVAHATPDAGIAVSRPRQGRNAQQGNQLLQRLVSESLVQAKPAISKPGDFLERQADQVADAVMRAGESASHMPAAIGAIAASGVHAVQRKCTECEKEAETVESRVRREDERPVIQARSADAGGDHAPQISQADLGSLQGAGEPMSPSTRSFFEQRMGHDFSGVRIHTGASADQLAAAAHARAFTHSNHVVFRSGEYAPTSPGGRHLLAHELAHTIQQGASAPASASASLAGVVAGLGRAPVGAIQRVCEFVDPPTDLACPPATSSVGRGTPIQFGLDSSVLSAGAKSTLSAIAAAWHSGGGFDTLRLDGFASCDGAAANNWRLSCSRAQTVALELEAPSDGSPGVDSAHIQPLANGETNQFSATAFEPNRRVEITNDAGTPPPGPACGLTITGPLEVDHFCAAYVPSDAVSCGVFPAPNITLNVTGAAATATLRWAITRGSSRASLVGPVNTASVAVKGDAASIAQGDVTVQVSDGTCTTNTFITVREPSDITPVQTPSSSPTNITNSITYTVRDQFGNPMGANACVDETITVCANNLTGAVFVFGDAGTDAAGRVTDTLSVTDPGGIPAGLCVKLNQSLTVGGCGPVRNNTITMQASGITLTGGASCVAGDACP